LKRLAYEDVKDAVEAEPGYKLLSKEYKNNKEKINIKHEVCGKDYFVRFSDWSAHGHRCPYCFGTHKKTVEEFNQELQQKNIDYECITYNGANTPSSFKCIKCETTFTMRPGDILHGHGCPNCYGTPKYAKEEVIKKINQIDPEYEPMINEYADNKTFFNIKHKTCGTIYQTTFNRFTNGRRCPVCARKFNSSKEEENFANYIESISDYKIERNKKFDNGQELDIFIPELNLGIEYDGIYWHSSKFRDKYYHMDKMNYFKNMNIRVINIFSDEWENKQDIIKNKLMSILNKNKTNIYARECSIVYNVLSHIKNNFLEQNHIQGADKSQFNCGLVYNDELVAIMTFAKPRVCLGNKKPIEDTYELVRYATSVRVIGGFSKLLKHALKQFYIKNIITYADLRFTSLESNVYSINGFTLDHVSKPDYFYIKNGLRLHRFNYMKQRLKTKLPEFYDDNKTELQITEAAGLYRIYDCGNAVYKLSV